jgi:hypothetical protein
MPGRPININYFRAGHDEFRASFYLKAQATLVNSWLWSGLVMMFFRGYFEMTGSRDSSE